MAHVFRSVPYKFILDDSKTDNEGEEEEGSGFRKDRTLFLVEKKTFRLQKMLIAQEKNFFRAASFLCLAIFSLSFYIDLH